MQMEILQLWTLFGLYIQITTLKSQRAVIQPSYLVLVPWELRSGSPVTLSVTILTSDAVSVHAEVLDDDLSIASNTTIVNGGSTELLHLPPVPPSHLSYMRPNTLRVSGHVGSKLLFTNSTLLYYSPKGLSTWIQTDKPNYRPGEAVKIRALSVQPGGRPHNSPVDVTIQDPRGNIVRQWSMNTTLGVASKEMQLSDGPPLGRWTIATTVDGVVTEKHFTVAHYVLPKFEVILDVPDVLHREDALLGTVTAKYMYGKPVRGHVNITYIHRFHGMKVAEEHIEEIDGSRHFQFEVPSNHNVSKHSEDFMFSDVDEEDESVTVVVHVTELVTGLTYSSNATVYLVRWRYKAAFEYHPSLKPSLNFTAKLKISTFDGRPLTLEDQEQTVTVSVMQHRRSPWNWMLEEAGQMMIPRMANLSEASGSLTDVPDERYQEMELAVPADGVVPLFFELYEDIYSLVIDAEFQDAYRTIRLSNSYWSPSRSYLQIQEPAAPPQVGAPLLLTIQSNMNVSEFHFMVKSRGHVVAAGKGSSPLLLTPEESWSPLAHVVVYCVQPDGEVINDVMMLPVTLSLRNKVSVGWSEDEARPADQVKLKLSVTEPHSLVALLVVDKATSGHQSHHDITMETVMGKLAEYSDTKEEHKQDQMGDPYSVFMSCDLQVLTDAALNMLGRPHKPFQGEGLEGVFLTDRDEPSAMEPRERWNFPETWLWMDIDTGASTTSEVSVAVPDSITTWKATAFVMSESLGLGIATVPAELTVFQDFFISLNLPAYIIRGEELVLEVNLFNYLLQLVEVMVVVDESDSFGFVMPDNEERGLASVRMVSVESQSGASVLFPIRPWVLGEMTISVKAMSPLASDAVRQTVLVKPEGLEQSFSTTLLLELSSVTYVSESLSFFFPEDVVEGSQRAQVTAVGDILGPSIDGLESLIKMPYGCGEQNMIHFAPNIYVIQYLQASGQSDPDTVTKATSYMMQGYERELSYQRQDGSFSAFGESDSSGSTWLSAFVLRCFLQARPFIRIDPSVTTRTVGWLAAQQGPGGGFQEPGRVIHTELQGGLDGPVSLTAYVLMALLEDDALKSQYSDQVSEATMYLETRLAMGVHSNYSLCLVSYALALSGSTSAPTVLETLMDRAQIRDGVPFWGSTSGGLAASWQPRSADIEMAAYVLLSLHELGRHVEGVGLVKWLSQQRNHLGGYGSTQDTVVALQALSSYASLLGEHNLDLTIKVNVGPIINVATFLINSNNHMLHQSQQIVADRELLELLVTAEGQGFALFQLTVFYNIEHNGVSRRRRDAAQSQAFHLDVELVDTEEQSPHLIICTRLLEGGGLEQTGMALLEVALLSGFTLAQEGVETSHVVKKVEASPGKVVLYLDSVTTTEMCVEIPLLVEYKVAKVRDATVIIYDYYEPRRRTERSYTSLRRSRMDSCTFCGPDCSQCKGESTNMAAGMAYTPHCPLLVALLCALLLLHGV